MERKIKATDYEITDEVSRYLDERLEAVERMVAGDPLARCEVTLGRAAGHSKHGENWFAEIALIQTGAGRTYAHAGAENINAAIDQVKDEIIKQLRREKRIHIRMMRKGGAMMKRLMRRE